MRVILGAGAIALIGCVSTGQVPQEKGPSVGGDRGWVVIGWPGNHHISVVDLDRGKSSSSAMARTIQLPGPLLRIELTASSEFAAVRVGNGEVSVRGHAYEDLLVDALSGSSSQCFDELGPSETRLSPGGRFAVFPSGSLLHLVPDAYLRDFLRRCPEGTSEGVQTLRGHPLGYSFPEEWVGPSLLLYGTGLGEASCWGLFDAANDENYFVGCCGSGGEGVDRFLPSCFSPRIEGRNLLRGSAEGTWPPPLKVGLDLYGAAMKLKKSK